MLSTYSDVGLSTQSVYACAGQLVSRAACPALSNCRPDAAGLHRHALFLLWDPLIDLPEARGLGDIAGVRMRCRVRDGAARVCGEHLLAERLGHALITAHTSLVLVHIRAWL
jgi:hypothetical protein